MVVIVRVVGVVMIVCIMGVVARALFIVGMRMAVSMVMSVIMAVVSMVSKASHTDQIDCQSHRTHNKQLQQSFRRSPLG